MNPLEYQELIETSWLRKLTPVEEERLRFYLAANPQAHAEWDQEKALNQLLQKLPDAPVSSNFTARVLQAVERAESKRARERRKIFSLEWLRLGWMPRVAVAGLAISVSFVSFREFQVVQRKKVADELAQVSQVATLPKMEWLKDFETIDRLSKVQVADTELLAMLK